LPAHTDADSAWRHKGSGALLQLVTFTAGRR
jgi:hypothetical protein